MKNERAESYHFEKKEKKRERETEREEERVIGREEEEGEEGDRS